MCSPQRNLSLGWLLATLMSVSGCFEPAAPKPQRPNVLIVVLDTTRADFISAYGHPKPTSPQFDRLAHEGIRFDHAYSTTYWTLPSHASLFTGRYPSEHGATSETNRLASRQRTLAESLAAAGYATAAFVSNVWISKERGFAQGFDSFVETWRDAPNHGDTFTLDKRATEGAIAWLADRPSDAQPFYLFLNLNSAHLPYSPKPLALVELTPEMRPPDQVARLRRLKGMWAHLAGKEDLNESDYEILRELYEAEILMIDGLIGELREALEKQGLLDDTLIILTADHGENIGDHGMIDHLLSMYESTLRIPLIMRYPPVFAPGTIDDSLVSLIDVVPTVFAITGVEDPRMVPSGRDLVSHEDSSRLFVVIENDRPMNAIDVMRSGYPEFDLTGIDHRTRVLHTGRYKLVWTSDGAIELFDLESDPGETIDLAEAKPELRDRLLESLNEWMRVRGDATQTPAAPSTDAQAHDELRALGYVE